MRAVAGPGSTGAEEAQREGGRKQRTWKAQALMSALMTSRYSLASAMSCSVRASAAWCSTVLVSMLAAVATR